MPKMRLFLIPTVFLAISLKAYAQDKHSDENRPYEFGFNIEGEQHRHEKKDENGIIMGEFGFITADGVYHVTVYATDENGNFKILSMKNIRLMPFPTTGAKSATPSTTTTTTTTTTARPYRGQLPASVNTAAPPDLDPRSLFKPNPQASCSSCSLPPKPVEQPARPSSNGFNGKAGVGRPLTNYKDTVEKQSPNSGLKASPRSDDDENSIFDERYNEAPINILSSNSPNQPNSKFRPGDADGSNSLFPPNNDPSNFSLNPPKDPVLQNRNFVPQDKKNTPKDRIFTPQERNIVPQAKNIPSQNRNFVPQDKNITPKDRMFTPQERNFAPQDQNVPPQDKNLNRNKAKLNHNADFKMDSVDPNNSNDLEKPLLLSGQMKPFEENAAYSGKEGLPDGLTAEDMMDLLYRFNYTVGFHGHHEDGYRNGDKSGDYFVNYRDGVQSKVEYKANEFGYQPNITRVQLGLDSPDTPKEETEKNEEFGLKGYEFKWFYVPKYHNLS